MACEHTRPEGDPGRDYEVYLLFLVYLLCRLQRTARSPVSGRVWDAGGSFSEYRGRVARKLLHNVFLFQLLLTRSDARECELLHALPRKGYGRRVEA